MRLIDADACTKLFDKEFKETMRLIRQGEIYLDNLAEGFAEAHIVIRSMPSVDAVNVVRCKDCKYGEVDNADFRDQYLCHISGSDWNCGNHFCSYGERKDGDGNG